MECMVNGCNKKGVSNGFCPGHFSQYKRYGKIIYQKLRTPTGRKKLPEYSSWRAMKERCCNKRNRAYKNYGERGIKVCDRWLDRADGFNNFLNDMGKRPEGYSLDRIDNDGDYCPENCKWSDRQQQNINRRIVGIPFITIRKTMSGLRYDVRVRDLKSQNKYVYKRRTCFSLEDAIKSRDIFIKELRKEKING